MCTHTSGVEIERKKENCTITHKTTTNKKCKIKTMNVFTANVFTAVFAEMFNAKKGTDAS